ncbi:MAG: cytochrome b N-terminal domain-containing protein [Desulfovibrio sp.]|nr:cytochrome b N-terminal domain-containing protein [Desulfovibrio sp.]
MANGQKRDKPPASPGRADWLCALGGLAFMVFFFQAASGIYLSLFFQPSPADAWESIEFIERDVRLGLFSRSLHRWGAFILMSLLCLHVLRVIFRGAWRRGWLIWCSGILLFLLAAAFALTGYLLPWDFRAYWTVKTVGNWLDRLPLFAGALKWFLFSDTANGIVPVGRWFALHILVLPLLAGVCFSAHFFLARGFRPGAPRRRGRFPDGDK